MRRNRVLVVLVLMSLFVITTQAFSVTSEPVIVDWQYDPWGDSQLSITTDSEVYTQVAANQVTFSFQLEIASGTETAVVRVELVDSAGDRVADADQTNTNPDDDSQWLVATEQTTSTITTVAPWTSADFTFNDGNVDSTISGGGYFVVYVSSTGSTMASLDTTPVDKTPVFTSDESTIIYRESTTGPYYQIYSSSAWGSATALGTGSTVSTVRIKYSPVEADKEIIIAGVLNTDGTLDVFDYFGSSWTQESPVTIAANAFSDPLRPFDVEFELTSGDGLLVYNAYGDGATSDISYKTYDPSTGIWSGASPIATAITGETTYLKLLRDPATSSNEIGLVGITDTNEVFGGIWDGSAWKSISSTQLYSISGAFGTTPTYTYGVADLAWTSTDLWVAYGEYRAVKLANTAGSTWTTSNTVALGTGSKQTDVNQMILRGKNNYMALVTVQQTDNDMFGAVYSSGSWETTATEIQSKVYRATERCFDGVWLNSEDAFLLFTALSENFKVRYNTWNLGSSGSWAFTSRWDDYSSSVGSKYYWLQASIIPYGSADTVMLAAVDNNNQVTSSTIYFYTTDPTAQTIAAGAPGDWVETSITANGINTFEVFQFSWGEFVQ